MNEPYEHIRLERDGHRAEVVLDNPGKLNAMSPEFFHEIRRAFGALDADAEVRVVLVWAEGRIFSSGLDLAEAGRLIPERPGESHAAVSRRLYETIVDFQDCFSAIGRCRKPVIAAVHGWCMGGGLDLATACDIRLASADASFAVHETKMAMVADLGSLQRLAPIVGQGLAREMCFTGEHVPAQRALAFGLVNDLFPDKQRLLEGARLLAGKIAENSPLAVQGVKQVLEYCASHDEAEGLEFVARWNTAYFRSADLAEAMRAFTEKRPPRYEGR